MKKVVMLICFVMLWGQAVLALDQIESKGFTWTPYKCTFIPSLELRGAVRVEEGSDFLVRWGAEKEVAMKRTEDACASIADNYGIDSSECFSPDEESLRCLKKWRGYYEY